jgi:ubiquinone biosynthesis protein
VFAANGFQNVAERIKLGRFVLERFTNADMDKYTAAERLRMCFEELGPTFVKLGQLLATRPDLVPLDFVEEFKKLHDQVSSLPFTRIQKVLEEQFGADIQTVFLEVDAVPMAAASIAQVHRARLVTGEDVVVKVQRPGIADVIADDVNILYFLADLLQKYIPETRLYNPVGIVDEFFKSLSLETNFIVEANNIRKFQENFKTDDTVKIPNVYFDLSGPRVLVMEALAGFPLSQKSALEQEGIDREEVIRTGLRCYFKMVFRDGFFHGDLHAGNLFILPNNQIGLVDFGIVGRLNRRVRDAIANMFVALYSEDYERLAYEYVELAPYNDLIDVDVFARDLQSLLAPFFGLSMKNMNLGRLLMDSTVVAAKHHVMLPSELMLFFKSVVTVEGMGHMVIKDFDLLGQALEFASELVKAKYEPKRIRDDLLMLSRDSAGMLYNLPRQIKQFVRKINHPDFAVRMSMVELEEIKRSIETSSNILFLGLIIGSLILASSIALFINHGPYLLGLPIPSALGLILASVLSLVAFFNYIRK